MNISSLPNNKGALLLRRAAANPTVQNTPFRGRSAINWPTVTLSPQAQTQLQTPTITRSGPETLQLFGGDRKTAIGTLIASGAKGENPDTSFFQDVFRKLFGGTKTKSKRISPTQTIGTKFKVKNFNLKELRLTTQAPGEGGAQVLRHIDFKTQAPTGGTAQIKDIGGVIAKGTPKRVFEQNVQYPAAGRQGKVVNHYFDPKTGQPFLRTTEVADRLETTKLGDVRSHKNKRTDRQIELLNADGDPTRRYVFDYGSKNIRLENLNSQGEVTSSYKLSKKTDFFDTVAQLSQNSPSARAAAAQALLNAPSQFGAVGGGGRSFLDRFAHLAQH